MVYPWHIESWHQLTQHWNQQSHALMLCGKSGTGKTTFAHHLAHALLCETPQTNHQPCMQCASCILFEHGGHPDFYTLSPEYSEHNNTSRKLPQIKIDAVRALTEPLNRTSIRGGKRIVLIAPAEAMNPQAANALLKILEEPPEAVMFLLIAHQRDKVLPTIKSRCRQWLLPSPTYQQALAYLNQQHPDSDNPALLAFHGGAPLFLRNTDQEEHREQLLALLTQPRLLSILDYAVAFEKSRQPLADLIDWINKWLIDMALAQYHQPPMYYPNHATASAQAAAKTNPATLFRYQNELNRLNPYGHHSLNVRIQTENLLTQYLMMMQKSTHRDNR